MGGGRKLGSRCQNRRCGSILGREVEASDGRTGILGSMARWAGGRWWLCFRRIVRECARDRVWSDRSKNQGPEYYTDGSEVEVALLALLKVVWALVVCLSVRETVRTTNYSTTHNNVAT